MSQLIRLTDLLPDYYDGVYEMHELTAVEQPQLDELQRIVEQVEANEFISIANDKGLSIFENMYGLKSSTNDSIDIRRFRLLTFLSMYRPYTIRYLREVLLSLDSSSTVTLIANEYKLIISTGLDGEGEVSELDNFLFQVVPSNLVLEANNSLSGKSVSEIYMYCGIVPTEMITITQDYHESTNIRSDIFIANANIQTANQDITQDYKEATEFNSGLILLNTSVPTSGQTLTQDYNAQSEVNGTHKGAQNQVVTEIIEIN